MKCPRCNVDIKPTEPGEYGFVTLDICPDCKGAWFDKGELDRVDDSVWVDAEREIEMREAESDHEGLKFPLCDAMLQAISPVDAAELIIDRCPNCEGFWLDDGELEKMRDVVDQKHTELWKSVVHLRRPPDWSRLRWVVYCYKTFR